MNENIDFSQLSNKSVDDLMKLLWEIEKNVFANSNGIAWEWDSEIDQKINSLENNSDLQKKLSFIKQLIQFYYFEVIKKDFLWNETELSKTKSLFLEMKQKYSWIWEILFWFIQKNFSWISDVFKNVSDQKELKNLSIKWIENCLIWFENVLSQIYWNENIKDKIWFFDDFVRNSYFLFWDLTTIDLSSKINNLYSLSFFSNSELEEFPYSTKIFNIDEKLLSKIDDFYTKKDEKWLIDYIKTSSELSFYRQDLLNLPKISSINEKLLKNSINPQTQLNLSSISKISDEYAIYSLTKFVDNYKKNPDKNILQNYIVWEFTKLSEKLNQTDFFLTLDFIYDNFLNDNETLSQFEKILKPKENKFKSDYQKFVQETKENLAKNPQNTYLLTALSQSNYKNFWNYSIETDKKPEISKKTIDWFNKIFWKNNKDISITSEWKIKILTENKSVKVWENQSIEMTENWDLLLINSLWYKFEFENNWFDLENMYVLVEKMDYFNKIWLWYFWNSFKDIIQIFKQTLPIELVWWLYVNEKQNDFLDFFELDLILSIFKKIWVLSTLQNTDFLLPDILKKSDFISNLEWLWSYNFFKDWLLDKQKLKDLLKNKFIKQQ